MTNKQVKQAHARDKRPYKGSLRHLAKDPIYLPRCFSERGTSREGSYWPAPSYPNPTCRGGGSEAWPVSYPAAETVDTTNKGEPKWQEQDTKGNDLKQRQDARGTKPD